MSLARSAQVSPAPALILESKLSHGRQWFALTAKLMVLAAGLLVLAAVGRFATRARGPGLLAGVDAGALRSSLPVERVEPIDAGSPAVIPIPPALAPPVAAPVAAPAPSRRATPDEPVYVNYASAEELRRLPGVGAKRAEAIVALRAKMGRFQRVEDLTRVKGIGRATIKKLRPLVRLDQPDAGAGSASAT